MRKIFTEVTKDQKKVTDVTPLDVMPKEMKEIYTDFHSDVERLEREWNLCMDQFDRANNVMFLKEATFGPRMEIKKIGTYWSNRRIALERVLSKELVDKFNENRSK